MDGEFIRRHGFGEEGRYAVVRFRDTGGGMDEETKKKIFDPFFTTKEVGKGTGLGLSTAYGVVKQHNGYIEVESSPGRGAEFIIYLPMAEELKELPAVEAKPPLEKAVTGTETILLAEDNPEVRAVNTAVLEELGYRVIAATDGEDAVRKFMENRDSIDALVFDVVMPRMNGRDAYNEIRKVAPDVRVLFMSGYNEEIIHTRGVLQAGLNFLPKPAAPAEFAEKLRALLDKD